MIYLLRSWWQWIRHVSYNSFCKSVLARWWKIQVPHSDLHQQRSLCQSRWWMVWLSYYLNHNALFRCHVQLEGIDCSSSHLRRKFLQRLCMHNNTNHEVRETTHTLEIHYKQCESQIIVLKLIYPFIKSQTI